VEERLSEVNIGCGRERLSEVYLGRELGVSVSGAERKGRSSKTRLSGKRKLSEERGKETGKMRRSTG
jgi:hypothetical protein